MTIRLWRGLALGAILPTIFVTACGAAPASSTTQAPVPPDTTPVTLTVWHAQNGNARNWLNTFSANFQKTYPWITINAEAKNSDGDLLKFGIAAMAVNLLPDLVIAAPRTLAEFARRGALVPLDSLIMQDKIGLNDDERAVFFPGLLPNQIAGSPDTLYAFPFEAHAVVLFYNASLLQTAKIPTAPKTWDEFSAAARATTRGETRGWAMMPSPIVYSAMLASRGGNILDEAQTKIQFNDDTGQKTIQFIAALARGGSAYVSDKPDQAHEDFIRGKTTFLFGSTDDLLTLSQASTRANKNFAWGVAMIPQSDPAHPATAISESAIGIFRTTGAHARAAWLFARWLAAPEQTAQWSRATLALPLRISAMGLLARDAATNPLGLLFRDGFDETAPTMHTLPTVANTAQIDAALVELWTTVGNGTDPNVALSRAVTRVSRVLGQSQ